MLRLYKYLNYLSVDVAIGAVISSLFCYSILNCEVDLVVLLVLGLVVWSIYTFDHIIDAKKATSKQLSPRHEFHLNNEQIISRVLIVVLIAIIPLLFFLPSNVILLGCGLSLIVVCYFLSINLLPTKKIYHKEITIGVVYFLGILVGPAGSIQTGVTVEQLLMLLTFLLIVLSNLIVFSHFDRYYDHLNDFPSIFRRHPQSMLSKLFYFLMIVHSVISIVLIQFGIIIPTLVMATMMSLLFSLYRTSSFYQLTDYHRFIGDGIFYLPAICLL